MNWFHKLGLALSATTLTFSNYAKERPNFIILQSDDINAVSLNSYGADNLKTSPNIDRLAEAGVMFGNMFVLDIDPNNGHILDNTNAQKLWKRSYRIGWQPERLRQ